MERKKATVRTLKKVVRELKPSETLYFNAISATPAMVDYIRACIFDGTLQPNPEWIDKMVHPSCVTRVLSGEVIMPQMEYIKKGASPCIES